MLKNVFRSIRSGDVLVINKNLTVGRVRELRACHINSTDFSDYGSSIDYAGKKGQVVSVDNSDNSVCIYIPERGENLWVPYRAIRKIRKTDK